MDNPRNFRATDFDRYSQRSRISSRMSMLSKGSRRSRLSMNSKSSRMSRLTFSSAKEPVDTFDSALELAEFGRFHLTLLMLCGVAYSLMSLVPSAMRYDMSDIECEFQLSIEDKKLVNDITYAGMLSGTVMWALLGDFCGRRVPLIGGLLLNSIATLGLALSRGLVTFSTFKFLCSASVSGVTLLAVILLAEYQLPRNRGAAISCLQLFWILGTVTLPALGLGWRTSVSLGSIPPLLVGVRLMFMSESPRFLMSTGDYQGTIVCFEDIFTTNTGIHRARYPVRYLRDNEALWELRDKEFPETIPEALTPKRYCMLVIMMIGIVLFFSYYTLGLWFTDLSSRFDFLLPVVRYTIPTPPNCELGDYAPSSRQNPLLVLPERGATNGTSDRDPCTEGTESGREHPFIRMLLVAFSCLPGTIWLMFNIDSLGRIFFLSISHVAAGCLVFCSYFVYYTPQDLLLASLFEAMCSLSIASCHCLALELSSTRWRCVALALVIGVSQLGAVFGNMGMAVRITGTCVFLVSTLAICIAATGLLSIALPDTVGMSLR